MTKHLKYYYTSISPFTYLGHAKLLEISHNSQVRINYKPVKLKEIFAESGAQPLSERPKSRQAYRLVELERWSQKRGRPINLNPRYFPTDPSLADKCSIALQELGHDAGEFTGRALTACWHLNKNISDEKVVKDILSSLRMDADTIIRYASSKDVNAIYDRNTIEAIENGVLGAPTYLLGDEQFWGQDRIELVQDALTLSN